MTALTDLLAELGLVEYSDVDGCESEARDRDFEWHRCTKPGDHTDDHENDYVGSWPQDDVDDPPKVRRHWIEGPGTLEDFAAVIEAHYATELDRVRAEAWDEGTAAPRMVDGSEEPAIANPYRTEPTEEAP